MPTISLVTWNVENLFRPKADAPEEERAAYDAKLGLLAQTLEEVDADLIALQEVGGDNALRDLQQALPAYAHARRGVADGRGIAVAFLSKLAFVETEDITDFPASVLALNVAELDGDPMRRMGRGALRVKVRKGNFSFHAITVHLKSKLLSFPLANGGTAFSTNDETLRAKVAAYALLRRAVESATVRTAAADLIAQNDDTGLVVLGDFNDVPEAATTALFQGPEGSELLTRGFDLGDEGDSARLWNLGLAIDEQRRFSRIHRGAGELIDHIFASEEFFPRGADNLRRLPTLSDALVENIQSISDNPNARISKVRPDHAPVLAVFELD